MLLTIGNGSPPMILERMVRSILATTMHVTLVGVGIIKFSFANGSSFVLKNVRHVPKLTKSLISVGQLDESGYQTTFGFLGWKIQKGSIVLARGAKCGTLYPLHVSSVIDNVVTITMQPNTS